MATAGRTWPRNTCAATDHVYADLSVFQIVDPCARKGTHGCFARSIHTEGWGALDARDGAVQNDGPSLVEQRQRLLRGEQSAAHIEVERLIKVLLKDLDRTLTMLWCRYSAQGYTERRQMPRHRGLQRLQSLSFHKSVHRFLAADRRWRNEGDVLLFA